jgi:hypothetical protein
MAFSGSYHDTVDLRKEDWDSNTPSTTGKHVRTSSLNFLQAKALWRVKETGLTKSLTQHLVHRAQALQVLLFAFLSLSLLNTCMFLGLQ